MRRPVAVPSAQWKLGLEASRRLGEWLAGWEERGKALRAGEEPPPPPSRRRRRPATAAPPPGE